MLQLPTRFSRGCVTHLLEISYVASTNNISAGSTASMTFSGLINLDTGVREGRTVVVTAPSACNASVYADAWAAALNTALAPYGGQAYRGVTTYGNVMFVLPYPTNNPFIDIVISNPNSAIAALNRFTWENTIASRYTDDVEDIAAQLDASLVTANQRITVLEASQAGGEVGTGSTVVTVNNPAVSTSQTIMAAIAGFGVGFMVAGRQETEE